MLRNSRCTERRGVSGGHHRGYMSRLVLLLVSVLGANAFSPAAHVRQRLSTFSLAGAPSYGAASPAKNSQPLLLAGDQKGDLAEVNPPGGSLVTALCLAIWYGTSVICNQTSKVLVASLGSQTLTLCQLIIAVGCGAAVLLGLRAFCSECAFPPVGIASREQLIDTAVLAAAFTGGFITLNACLTSMHVSLVMVLRAAEPLTTLAIGASFFGTRVPLGKAAILLVIVAGCALSSAGAFQATANGLALAALSNICFSLRGLLGKRLSARYRGGDVEVFFQLCAIGAVLQAALLLCTSGTASFAALATTLTGPDLGTALINGVTFYAYLCLSWVCLGRMSAVSHSVANSLRRPVTVVAALAYSPIVLSPTNIAGIVLACAAAAVYGLI